jgi:AcrR family transcriptional regulator
MGQQAFSPRSWREPAAWTGQRCRPLCGIAARQVLAESGDTSASIQAIAERADVGFGSHFKTKAELFEAAVVDVLEEFGQAFDEHLTGIDDPAELVADGFRLSARMADSRPELMQVLCRRGFGHIHSDNGLARRALRDLHAGIASARFTTLDPVVALSARRGCVQ